MIKQLIFILILSIVPGLYGDDRILASPIGGWSYSDPDDSSETVQVSYPTPPIDRGGLNHRMMIAGKLKSLKGKRKPLLVANGNPMLLNTDKNGNYRRFYAFGRGSNSTEVIDAEGRKQKVQFYEANPNRIEAKIRIICSWDAPGAEVDLHILTPDGQHAFWANPRLREGDGLDPDSVDGPGPEMFTWSTPIHGTYHIFVNYWGNLDEEGYNFDGAKREKALITTRITLVFDENTPNEKRESFVIPLRRVSDLTHVKSFLY